MACRLSFRFARASAFAVCAAFSLAATSASADTRGVANTANALINLFTQPEQDEPKPAPKPPARRKPVAHVAHAAPKKAPVVAHVAPKPVVRAAPPVVAHVAPKPVVHAAPPVVAHVAPKPVMRVAPPVVAHVAPKPVVHVAAPVVAHVAPKPVVHVAAPVVAHVAPKPAVRKVLHQSAMLAAVQGVPVPAPMVKHAQKMKPRYKPMHITSAILNTPAQALALAKAAYLKRKHARTTVARAHAHAPSAVSAAHDAAVPDDYCELPSGCPQPAAEPAITY